LCVERQREKEQKRKGGDRKPGGFHGLSSTIVHKLAARRQAVARRLAAILAEQIASIPASNGSLTRD